MKTSELSSFLAKYCTNDPEAPPYSARGYIGDIKRSAKVWQRKPFTLNGKDSSKCAQTIMDYLDEERGKKAQKAWIAVYEHGDTSPTEWIGGRDGIYLHPLETDEDEQKESDYTEDIPIKGKGAAALFAALVHGTIASANSDRQWAAARLRESAERIEHLENMASKLYDAKLSDAVMIAELKASALQTSDPLNTAISSFAPLLTAALPDILSKFGKKNETGNSEPMPPDAEWDALAAALATHTQAHPEILTSERVNAVQMFAQMVSQAYNQGKN